MFQYLLATSSDKKRTTHTQKKKKVYIKKGQKYKKIAIQQIRMPLYQVKSRLR